MKQESVEALVNLVNSVVFSLHRLLAIAILGALAYGMVTTSDTYRSTVVDEGKIAEQCDHVCSDAAASARRAQHQRAATSEGWDYSDDAYGSSDPEPYFDSEGGWAD